MREKKQGGTIEREGGGKGEELGALAVRRNTVEKGWPTSYPPAVESERQPDGRRDGRARGRPGRVLFQTDGRRMRDST